MSIINIIQGDCLNVLPTLPDESVNCVVTSPPYWGLRDYGTAKWEGGDAKCDHKGKLMPTRTGFNERYFGRKSSPYNKQDAVHEPMGQVCSKCGAIRIDDQIGLERTPEEYVAKMVAVFREVRRVLRDDGTLWLNLGDSYASSGERSNNNGEGASTMGWANQRHETLNKAVGIKLPAVNHGLKPKDLVGIPWHVAFALQADGWWLRQDIIWCLSGGTYIYAKTQKGVGVMMVRELIRLDPSAVQLWTGERWTRLLGISKSKRSGAELEIVLRSGERISCTPTHKFPTDRGLIEAGSLAVGDSLIRVNLPDNNSNKDCAIDNDAAWFAGLYIAEGSKSGDCIQIAGHIKETERWDWVQQIAKKFGGSATITVDGNNMAIRVYGKLLLALIDELVTGRIAKDKGFSLSVWKYSNEFIKSMLEGYLSGDGHWDKDNNRWRLGFTRNYNLERDIRTACARLGYHLVLNLSTVKYNGKQIPAFRGEIRYSTSDHHNCKDTGEIVEIRKARCREVYDLGIEDESHVFALASGILTHNSKPNPMPESVRDRCTKAHEYIFLLSKSAKYYYDADAIQEIATGYDGRKDDQFKGSTKYKDSGQTFAERGHKRWQYKNLEEDGQTPNTMHLKRLEGKEYLSPVRNKRSVWTVSTKPYSGAHFATFPPDLIEPCILAGCPATVCVKCGMPYVRVTERNQPEVQPLSEVRITPQGTHKAIGQKYNQWLIDNPKTTIGFQPTCDCNAGTMPGTVLDLFNGSGTTGMVSVKHNRNYIGIELNQEYIELSHKRINGIQMRLVME